MLAAVAFALLIGAGPALPPAAPPAVVAVPDEPGSMMLPEVPTFQAIAADLDGDGTREVVRLVGGPRGSIRVEAWAMRDRGWRQLGADIEVMPQRVTGTQANVVYAGSPARLLVRRVEGGERVTLIRQPSFQEPDIEPECCLLLDDLVLDGDALRLVSVALPASSVDAVLALDFDGDGTDELLTTRSLPVVGDTSYPTEAHVYRWNGSTLAPPTVTTLPIGSGDTPFVLGDTDGLPGEEAAIIATLGRPALYRLTLTDTDELSVDDAGFAAFSARAIPLGDGRGVAVIGLSSGDLSVHAWPPGGALDPPLAELSLPEGRSTRMLGVVEAGGAPALLVERPQAGRVHIVTLPSLDAMRQSLIPSPAASAVQIGGMAPYIGPLPGGGVDGGPAVIYAGRLLPPAVQADAPSSVVAADRLAALPASEPIGLVGPDRGWMALLHGPSASGPIDPAGGRLDAPVLRPASGVSIAPIALVGEPERDDGLLDPPLVDAVPIGDGGAIAIGPDGFAAEITAPAGSRVYFMGRDPSVTGAIHVVPEAGRLRLAIDAPGNATPSPRFGLIVTVVTPAGRGYVASWDVRVLAGAPPLEARTVTVFGSASVRVSGQTALETVVSVDGTRVSVDAAGSFATEVDLPPWPTEIRVVATDLVGNETSVTVVGTGLVDYRTLPWIPMVAILVALAALVLFLRVPRVAPEPRREDDDASLEELEAD
jgi:hypothetical protein